ncbi:MAG: hypothetical protein AVDCRST_MAG87-2473 [uncultured Thermomicrobiales bacterium]|uniref:Uncharacterized protein n=1 Tax=uncultured Thermomicrobiales bacterium TaxID=1645740 RepID=A0A6J4V7Q6_9BACT|nr:MAG: hypothetical protein AVDCRST_MAG87-2473 [uncultured Thermomicrobiales bacterium]
MPDHGVHPEGGADIAWQREVFPPARGQFPTKPGDGFDVAVDAGEAAAAGREGAGRGLAQPAPGAGHERGFPGKVHVVRHDVPPFTPFHPDSP